MTHPRLAALLGHGQSPWLDQVRREWLADGTLASWVQRGVCGVTSNPTIFAEAIRAGSGYVEQVQALSAEGMDSAAIYDRVTLDDIRSACDVFADVYESTAGVDGFVSHEVAPSMAHDSHSSVNEARRLWAEIGRPNAMIKIPATDAGMPAVRQSIAEGINVNITLMFTLRQYDAVAKAYIEALEERASAGLPVDGIASVASFFVSRLDTAIDGMLRARRAALPEGSSEERSLAALEGRAAVANATRAYARMLAVFGGERWARLSALGARPQRLLWASTSTKDPAYDDLKYVTELIAPGTVNTLPLATLEAVLDHGRVEGVLDGGTAEADAVVGSLGAHGIDVERVGTQALTDGIGKFAASFEEARSAVEAISSVVR